MTVLSASEAREHLPEALNNVTYGGERILIKRRGKVVGAIISGDDLALLEALEDRYWAEAGEKALKEMKSKRRKPVPWEKVKKTLGL